MEFLAVDETFHELNVVSDQHDFTPNHRELKVKAKSS